MAALLASAVPAWGAPPSADTNLLSGPVPNAQVSDWLGARDNAGQWTDKDGPVQFALSVSSHGNVIECLVEKSSGSPDLDDKVCRRLKSRAEFRPASDARGQAVLGVWRGTSAPGAPADMAIGLQHMPAGLGDPANVDVAVSVDRFGRVTACHPAEGQGAPAGVLGSTACAEALKGLRLNPARANSNLAGASVQTARIMFTADARTFATAVSDPAATLSAAAGNGRDIVVTGRQIVGRREAVVPFRGFDPVRDFDPIAYETVLIETYGGKWYRVKLEPPCIGNDSMMPKGGGRQPAMAFVPHADGTLDRFSEVYVRGLRPPLINGRCYIESLVDSAPPKVVKAQMKAERKARIAAKEAAR